MATPWCALRGADLAGLALLNAAGDDGPYPHHRLPWPTGANYDLAASGAGQPLIGERILHAQTESTAVSIARQQGMERRDGCRIH